MIEGGWIVATSKNYDRLRFSREKKHAVNWQVVVQLSKKFIYTVLLYDPYLFLNILLFTYIYKLITKYVHFRSAKRAVQKHSSLFQKLNSKRLLPTDFIVFRPSLS